jgi:hypothetical protein
VQGTPFAGEEHTAKIGEFGGRFATRNGGWVLETLGNGASNLTFCAATPATYRAQKIVMEISFFMAGRKNLARQHCQNRYHG